MPRCAPKNGAARYDVLQWLMVQMTGQGPMSGQLVHFLRFAPEGNSYAHDRYRTQVRTVYKALDTRLGRSRYLGGDSYTVADIATYPWTRIAETISKGITAELPNLKRWFDEMHARPAVVNAVAAADAARARTSTYDKVNSDQLDRFLQRGRYTARLAHAVRHAAFDWLRCSTKPAIKHFLDGRDAHSLALGASSEPD
jgi:GST-like protein